MLLWPVHAALEAGAEKVVVVDSPARALEGCCRRASSWRCSHSPNGTGGAVAAAMAQLESQAGETSLEPDTPVVVLSGDVPLVSAEAIRELTEAHAQSGAAATMVTTVLEDPTRLRPGGARRGRRGRARGRDEEGRRREPGGARDQRGEHRHLRLRPRARWQAALPRLSAENAQGELYLPQVLDILRADGRAVAAHAVEDQNLVLGVNDRVALAQVRKLAQRAINERHMRAGVDDRRPRRRR